MTKFLAAIVKLNDSFKTFQSIPDYHHKMGSMYIPFMVFERLKLVLIRGTLELVGCIRPAVDIDLVADG